MLIVKTMYWKNNVLTFISLVFLSISSCLSQDRSVNSENVLQWQKNYRLHLEDFQKPRQPNDSYSYTAYKIEFYPSEVMVDRNDYIQDYQDLTVIAEFHMDQSHFHPDYESDLLEFERLTFDIAELYARKIRQKFDELKASKEKRFSAYQYEYSVLLNDCLQYQSEFRKATNSGWGSKVKFHDWQIKINKELKSLEEYAIKPL